MRLLGSFAALLFLALHFFSGNAATFSFHNKCPFPIWPATAPITGHPVIAKGGFSLPSGHTHRISSPTSWIGRIWARTGCNFTSTRKPACETGDCNGKLKCNGVIGTPPATLLEISLESDPSKRSFYDVSLVDGFNVPISVTTGPNIEPKCTIEGCSGDMKSSCPPELQVRNEKKEIVACKSACLAFDLDNFCCRNEYRSPEKCGPSVYSKMFKRACPAYFSYAFDTPPPLRNCGSEQYEITFCPSTVSA